MGPHYNIRECFYVESTCPVKPTNCEPMALAEFNEAQKMNVEHTAMGGLTKPWVLHMLRIMSARG